MLGSYYLSAVYIYIYPPTDSTTSTLGAVVWLVSFLLSFHCMGCEHTIRRLGVLGMGWLSLCSLSAVW